MLAEAGALASLEGDRRAALWEGRGLVGRPGETLSLPPRDVTPAFAPLTPDEVIAWDYRTTRHSPRGHPLQPLRPFLQAHGLPDARRVAELPEGDLVRFVGMVITRQRPGTAKGVVFLTLEDETGFVNVVLWPQVFRRYAVLAKTARVLGVTGALQRQADVGHLLARQLWSPRFQGHPPPTPVGIFTETHTPRGQRGRPQASAGTGRRWGRARCNAAAKPVYRCTP